MKLIADLHIHSRFSRATSRDLDFIALHRSALEKGIGLVGTGDFTHPGWMAEIEEQLIPAEDGFFVLKPELKRKAEAGLPDSCNGEVRFVLQVEISNIYKKGDRTRKNHNLVYVPTLEAARRFTEKLSAVGNLASDGRPILGLDARHLLEIVLETDSAAFLIPAHIWTPWFSMLGSKSGFDSVEECFGDLSSEIFAVETGLSSDPPMNWRVANLDRMTLVSNSDAHSASKLGREANLLDIELGYLPLLHALKTGEGFLGTLEFFPEHGKYHMDGHRKCNLRLSPEETRAFGGRCPTCGGLITVGVMSRVADLAETGRPEGFAPEDKPAFESIVPLDETISEVLGVGPSSNKVRALAAKLVSRLGPELYVLRSAPLEEIEATAGVAMREAVRRIRAKEMAMDAGYDGEFGVVRVFTEKERAELIGQIGFAVGGFEMESSRAKKKSFSKKAAEGEPSRKSKVAADASHDAGGTSLFALNALQQQVVDSPNGPIAVSAGPGTGKTKTLTARIARHVTDGLWQKQRVLAVTFTNQAATELRERLALALSEIRGDGPVVETFHGFGKRILEQYGSRPVQTADDEKRRSLAAEALGEGVGDKEIERAVEAISLAKQSPETENQFDDASMLSVFHQYQALLEREGLFDVDDLVLKAHDLLRQNPDIASTVQASFDAISVDEYQDVNDVQAALIKLLSPTGHNLLVIGDPDQAIYGFRGARPGHFHRFAEDFDAAQIVSLDTSYRLTTPILTAAQGILGASRALRAPKTGPKVEIVSCPTEESEAEQLLLRLERLIGGTSSFAVNSGRGGDAEEPGIGFGDVAVLCRLKSQRAAVAEALSRSGVPCALVGEDEPHDPRSEKVALMTMHASKGREFEVVFIIGVEPGLMPLDLVGLRSDAEEERRLLYVAATRAKRRLVLSSVARRTLFGRRLPGGESAFLSGLRSDCSVRITASFRVSAAKRQLSLF